MSNRLGLWAWPANPQHAVQEWYRPAQPLLSLDKEVRWSTADRPERNDP